MSVIRTYLYLTSPAVILCCSFSYTHNSNTAQPLLFQSGHAGPMLPILDLISMLDLNSLFTPQKYWHKKQGMSGKQSSELLSLANRASTYQGTAEHDCDR